MIIDVALEYDLTMTYIVGMVCDDGILLASDGLAGQFDIKQDKWLEPLTGAKKIIKVSDSISAAFAGSVGNLQAAEAYLSQAASLFNISELETAKLVGQSTAKAFDPIIRRHKRGMQIIIGCFSNRPQLYLYERYIADEDGEALYPSLTGAVDAGFNMNTTETLSTQYEKSPKDYKSLKALAIHMIELAEKDYPDDVGGDYFISHITKSGVANERIKR